MIQTGFMNQKFSVACMAVLLSTLSACGPALKDWAPERDKKAHAIAYRQTAPQPVYSRLRWVHLPETMPAREIPESEAPTIFPVFHLDLKNASLEEAARALAATTRYSSYCSSSLVDRKISMNRLGTLDELAHEIAATTGISVQVDHSMKTVRFLPKLIVQPEPQFADELTENLSEGLNSEVSEHEHQSDN